MVSMSTSTRQRMPSDEYSLADLVSVIGLIGCNRGSVKPENTLDFFCYKTVYNAFCMTQAEPVFRPVFLIRSINVPLFHPTFRITQSCVVEVLNLESTIEVETCFNFLCCMFHRVGLLT
jgi:hypothetical protein